MVHEKEEEEEEDRFFALLLALDRAEQWIFA